MLNALVLDAGTAESPQPTTSGCQGGGKEQEEVTPDEHAANMVQLSEQAKASLFLPQGEQLHLNINNLNVPSKVIPDKDISIMDQDYIVVSGHIGQALQDRIILANMWTSVSCFPRTKSPPWMMKNWS